MIDAPRGRSDLPLLNAFCVDLEEWFHVGGTDPAHFNISSWESAESHVEKDTEAFLEMLAEFRHKGTFLTLGWIAEKYPDLIRRISDQGHEIGCHGYYHRLVWSQTPEQFREEIKRARKLLQDASGQRVVCFRAPNFSMKKECLWAIPILIEEGFEIDVSIVPARRSNGGIVGFSRDPLMLGTQAGDITIFPVSVMQFLGKTVQFSGGGYLRTLPAHLINRGFQENHRAGRPVMTYIHPREIDPDTPRLSLPAAQHFRHYLGLHTVRPKLRRLLNQYQFGTVSEVISSYETLPEYRLLDGEIVPVSAESSARLPRDSHQRGLG